MNSNAFKVIKVISAVAGVIVPLVASYVSKVELDEKVAKKVAEQLAENGKES